MAEPDESELSPTLAETAKRRADLHHALIAVEQATSRAAAGREADWTKEVVLRLEDLSHAIAEHVQVTEREGGLYDEICGLAPHLSSKIDRLREEHPVMQRGTEELTTKFRTTEPGGDWSLDDARDDLQRLLGKLVRHRQLGSDLVWEAYNLDIGGIE